MHVGQMIGGLDVYIRNTITYAGDGFEFIIVHGIDDESSPVFYMGNAVKEYKVTLQRNLSMWKDLKCLLQVIKIIRREKPDIVHCHSAKGGVIGRIAGWLTHTTVFYTPHAFSFLCTPSQAKKAIYKLVERFTKFKTFVIACSESEQEMARNMVGYDEEHAKVWHNAVPDASKEIGRKANVEGEYVCYIGRPCYQKNVLFLIDVIKEVRYNGCPIRFVLLGVGYHSPELQAVKDKIHEFGLEDSIEMVPWISHSDCQEYVKGSLFYVTTALYEGLPLAVIEAMAQGKAVVASDVTGNRDCVVNNLTGFLLPLQVSTFAEHISQLVNDDALREGMGVAAREAFVNTFYIANRIHLLMDLYIEVESNEI